MSYSPAYPYPPYAPYGYQPPRQDLTVQSFQNQATAQPQIQTQMQHPGFTCHPVTSREEALAIQVDFMGAGTIMPDLAHGTIYLKKFNQNTGACDLFAFTVQQPETPPPPPEYATRQELEALREELIRKVKGGGKNDPDE